MVQLTCGGADSVKPYNTRTSLTDTISKYDVGWPTRTRNSGGVRYTPHAPKFLSDIDLDHLLTRLKALRPPFPSIYTAFLLCWIERFRVESRRRRQARPAPHQILARGGYSLRRIRIIPLRFRDFPASWFGGGDAGAAAGTYLLTILTILTTLRRGEAG